ncbi:protein SMG9-like [Dioscorea cayenensis subsp. rotundata]|uniref:Protein SMG9-like n=1 Tax=Dioscorea cayennensis subsp. rotundata TaxID=55577 RepID=A0AB40CHU8_DIOCR|nr:protein SMG9-like [Dioscorea cayenensis subsp. rotundata]
MANGASSSAASSSSSSSGLPPPPPPPKILLAKPPSAPRLARDDDSSAAASRSRNPYPSSLNFLSADSWDLLPDRVLPFLTENTDFTVVGVIGPPGVGKSTILNELYGFETSSPGMPLPFVVQSDESKAMARHCTMGMELRVSAERLILIDSQPVFSPSVLLDMMKPDGLSTIPVLNGESLPADLAHELIGIQLGVFLASVCNVLLVVSEGIHDYSMWKLMLTVDLLKHGLPDPSLLTPGHFQGCSSGLDKENKADVQGGTEDFLAALVFIHTKLRVEDLSPPNISLLRNALTQYFKSSTFIMSDNGSSSERQTDSSGPHVAKFGKDFRGPDLFFLPLKLREDSQKIQFESYSSMLGKLRDQLLSMHGRPFAKNIAERDWLRSSAKIWDLVKKSPAIADYSKILQKSGLFRK